MTFVIWFFFLGGFAFNLWLLAHLDVRRLDFMDGVLIGQLYFVVIPLAFFLITGSVSMEEVSLTWRPYQDLSTTWTLLIGLYLLPALRMVLPRPGKRRDRTDPLLFRAVFILFVVSLLATFQMSGLGSGGHWQRNLEEAFNNNPAFVFAKHAANFSRTVIFGLLIYQVTNRRLSKPVAIGVGLVVALLDLLLTFNRITAAYLLIAIILMLRRNIVRLLVGATSLILLSSVSLFWPMFRSLATDGSYSLESMRRAADLSAAYSHTGGIDRALNGVFESTNLVVLNWIVNDFGRNGESYLMGEMFIRPATVLLPKAVWAGRPDAFGPKLGAAIANIPELALNSTLYGEAFANFGWAWPLALALFLTIFHYLFRWLAGDMRAVGLMAAFVAVAMWRFDSSYAGVALILTGLIVGGLRLFRASSHPGRRSGRGIPVRQRRRESAFNAGLGSSAHSPQDMPTL